MVYLHSYSYGPRGKRQVNDLHQFRLALVDIEALDRTYHYLSELGINTYKSLFQKLPKQPRNFGQLKPVKKYR